LKYEYKFATVGKASNEELQTLNDLGEEGWEVVGVAFGIVILKREKK